MIYKDELERMKNELEERKEDLKNELKTLPDGVLLCTDENGQRRYYQRFAAIGNRKKERRYGVKTKPEVLNGLIRKKYIAGALNNIDHDLKVIEKAYRSYKSVDELDVMEPFLCKYPELTDRIYSDPIDLKQWESEYERIDNYHPESLKQTDVNGVKWRSKNELYIASRLDHYGVPYRFDCPTGIPGLRWAADFIALNKRTRKKYYWEHFGMMSDPGYRRRNKIKMAEYEEAGIVPWDNMIVTYDMNGIDMRAGIIESKIKLMLL